MLTVKVTKQAVDAENFPIPGRFSTRIVEAVEVSVHILRPHELTEVAGTQEDGKSFAFLVAPRDAPKPPDFPASTDFWFDAYIENAAGATTQVVKF